MGTTQIAKAPASRLTKIRLAVAAFVAATALVGGAPHMNPPAQAATGVQYCFVYSNGVPATTGTNVYTQLLAWTATGYKWLANGTTAKNGCGYLPVPAAYRNSYVRVTFNAHVGSAQWFGISPYWATPGAGAPFVGTGTVYRIR